MPDSSLPSTTPENAASPAVGTLTSRRHTLNLPRTRIGRAALHLQDGLESAVAAASVHVDTPVYDRAQFPWVAEVEAGWREARAELDAVIGCRADMPSFHEIIREVDTITHDDQWKTFFLQGVGMDCSANAARCPKTMALLRRIPHSGTAFFSILSPHKHIPPHRGAYNGVLRLHLGLLVPEPAERCRIRIADRIRYWREGEALIFDDSYNHEVWNDTDGYRVVLFVDFARPLRCPWDALNRGFLRLGPLLPQLRRAGARHRLWEKTFYGGRRNRDDH